MTQPSAKIIADSISVDGARLTTMEVTFHRFILAEVNTHRAFSRSSASSRAIPVWKQIEKVIDDPAIPIEWTSEQPGMQGGAEVDTFSQKAAWEDWMDCRDEAVYRAKDMVKLGIHKSIVNRLLEPFMWHTAIISATDYSNFFKQRCSPDAQPEMRALAEAMRGAFEASIPSEPCAGWHMPYLTQDDIYNPDLSLQDLQKISAARCARVSYLTHDGVRDLDKDLELYGKLVSQGHWCYDDQTEVLTSDGFRLWENVQDDDMLGCWDPKRQSLVYENSLAMHRFDYDGEMYCVEHPKVSLAVTPNHQMWVSLRQNHGKSGMEWLSPQLIVASDLGNRSMVKYHKIAPFIHDDLVELKMLPQHDNRDAMLKFIGFFLGDGHAGNLESTNQNRIEFHLRRSRKIAYLRQLCHVLGWNLNEFSHDSYVIKFSGIGKLFRETFYDDMSNKTFPEEFLCANQHDALMLLDGLKNSDGSVKRNTWTYSSMSERLLSQMEILAIHAGLSTSRTQNDHIQGLSFHTRSEPVVNQGRKNVHATPYCGRVYCATTRTGVLVVRRNGQVVLSGNSPLEHVARPGKLIEEARMGRNFNGWVQLRHIEEDKRND